MTKANTIFDEKPEEKPVTAPETPKEAPPEPPKEPPKPIPPIIVPITTDCLNGPANQHEWSLHEEIGFVACVHCHAKADIVDIIGLYQKAGVALKKDAFVFKERLERELGHKVILGKTRENCQTDREKELFDESEYFQKRLQEEIDANGELKKNLATHSRKVNELIAEGTKREKGYEDIKKDRNRWKEGYNTLQVDAEAAINELKVIISKTP